MTLCLTLQNRRSALFYAAQGGHELLVVDLIRRGAMTDIKDVVNTISLFSGKSIMLLALI